MALLRTGQNEEDFTSPATSWLMDHFLLVPPRALAVGKGKSVLRPHTLGIKLNFNSS